MRQFWAFALICTVIGVLVLAVLRLHGPLYGATAVVQVRPGIDVAAAKAQLTSRQNLLVMVLRHGMATSQSDKGAGQAAAALRQSISVRDLTSGAGEVLGFDAEVAGIVVSVLMPDGTLAMRVANDLAQQLLDAGTAGVLWQGQADLLFYRREELRLWQETSALRAELDTLGASAGNADGHLNNRRRLVLMIDQYDHVRRKLAEFEVDARLAISGQAGFSLLQRASVAEEVRGGQNWLWVAVAGSLLMAGAVALRLDWRMTGGLALRHGFRRVWRWVDDPDRPVLGVPRSLMVRAAVVVGLVGVAALL